MNDTELMGGQDFWPPSRRRERFERPYQTAPGKLRERLLKPFAVARPKILLVDLSHHNVADFQKLAESGVQGVILKASEGLSFKDGKFEAYWRAALDNGLPVMTYHFFRDQQDEAGWYFECADAFLAEVGGKTACWLDVETDNGVGKQVRADRAFAFCEAVRSQGVKDGVYSSPYYINLLFPPNDPRWPDVWQWDAHWTGAGEPALPNGWSWDRMKLWQFGIYPTHSWTIPIQGVAGGVDEDWGFFESKQDLAEWLGFGSQNGGSMQPFNKEITVIAAAGENNASTLPIQGGTCLEVQGLTLFTDYPVKARVAFIAQDGMTIIVDPITTFDGFHPVKFTGKTLFPGQSLKVTFYEAVPSSQLKVQYFGVLRPI